MIEFWRIDAGEAYPHIVDHDYVAVDDPTLALQDHRLCDLRLRARYSLWYKPVTQMSNGLIVPLQNRVTPFGEIVIDPSRGSLMGNRGILHDSNQQLGSSRWKHKNWVTCTLSFKGTKRPPMAAGKYTELFFLDEATALAAGHRPCAECRRPDFERFMSAWTEGNQLPDRPRAPMMDAELHAHRVTRTGQRVTYREHANSLPDGTILLLDGEAWLLWRGLLHRWSFTGYRDRQPLNRAEVEVLTPMPSVGALRGGYVPTVHESADRS